MYCCCSMAMREFERGGSLPCCQRAGSGPFGAGRLKLDLFALRPSAKMWSFIHFMPYLQLPYIQSVYRLALAQRRGYRMQSEATDTCLLEVLAWLHGRLYRMRKRT